MKQIIFILVLFCLYIAAKPHWFELDEYNFENYVKEFGKQYSLEEYNERKAIFDSHLDEIRKHNKDNSLSWKRGINKMTDWTQQEFRKLLGLKKSYLFKNKALHNTTSIPSSVHLPVQVDWRQKGIITPVKDQGLCGSCWSFGSAESVESFYALKTGLLEELSEQQILDCTPNPNDCGGTGGCGGGTPELAFEQMLNKGLTSEWTYPYISYSGSNYKCQNSKLTATASLSGYKVLPSNQVAPVLQALATVGPLAVNVDASAWSDYDSGVFDGCALKNPDINHVVQLVGYGTDTQYGDYWLVRNSWAASYGEKGYIRIKRTTIPRCGIDLNPSDGTGCNGGPANVTVCGTCGIIYDVSYPVIA